jgi:hypothetical protein
MVHSGGGDIQWDGDGAAAGQYITRYLSVPLSQGIDNFAHMLSTF